LDTKGGPNYASNFVDSAIVANGSEIYKQPIFYAIGHFSRFILPDSVRIYSKSSHKFIKSTAYLRPDGYTAIILYNIADHELDVNIFDKTNGVLRMSLEAKSIHTLIYK
jgi:glucosylceramidase